MKANLKLERARTISKIDDRIYGSFVEHMGRCVYHGIYEPTHPTADENGFRKDVMELVKKLNIPIIRYPGGNFVSGYEWEDGVGKNRKPTLDPAWIQIEPNEVGTDEFHTWAEKVGSSVMMAVNLGTRGPADAMHLYEYCNFPEGTKYADMRVENGHREPYGDKVWCLGNEMDGIWQVGHRSPEDYAQIARKTACLLKMLDPSAELVACGSAAYTMPTFGKWERCVLEQAYDHIEYLSLHRYYQNEGKDTKEYLGCANEMDKYIDTLAAICDAVGGSRRTNKKINLSFDEWNVWPKKKCDNEIGRWTVGPRRDEFECTMEDSLVFGTMLNTLINHADRVKMACLAQLVNVCGPIMTENNGPAWVQTTYYPYLYASNFGRGDALEITMDCPHYNTRRYGDVSYVNCAAVWNADKQEVVVFAVNRSLDEDVELNVSFDAAMTPVEHVVLANDDLDASNTLEHPEDVQPYQVKNVDKIVLPRASWNMVRFQVK